MAGHRKWSEIKRKAKKMQEARTTVFDIDDPEFQDVILERVAFYPPSEYEDGTEIEGGYEINFDGGTCFWIPQKYGAGPMVGDTVRFYGKGFGYVVRGVALRGTVLYYRTEEQQDAKNKADAAAHEAKMLREYEAMADERATTISLLPQAYQKRLEKMRKNNPTFWRIEPYEVYVCQQAMVIAMKLGTPDAVHEFYGLDYNAQREMVPELDEGHSGNTFGCACLLARLYLEDPEYVKQAHAASAPLLGCIEAGCHTPEDFPEEKSLAVV